MDVSVLRTFVTVARLGSMTRAAAQLYQAQPTVTAHIQRVEQSLGVRLFTRSRRGVRLSAAGRRFLPHAERALAELDAAHEDLARWQQGYRRQLTLAASPLIAASSLPPLLARFTREQPDVEVSVLVRPSQEIEAVVAAGAADLGLARMPATGDGMACETLYRDPVLLVAPHDGRDWDAEPPDFEQVLESYLLLTHNHPGYWDDLLSTLRGRGLRIRTIRVSEVNVTRRFIEEGLGASFLPESTVRRELVEGRLLEVPTPGLVLPEAFTYLVRRDEADIAPAAEAFAGLLRSIFGGA
ncbi:MAG TPA: LysR family transcriptional regulator [Bacillota bacterium]